MDRALLPVSEVAARKSNKDSGFDKLSNEQLAVEVQRFSGYHHLSRSSTNLLDEVVRRLFNEGKATQTERSSAADSKDTVFSMQLNHRLMSLVGIEVYRDAFIQELTDLYTAAKKQFSSAVSLRALVRVIEKGVSPGCTGKIWVEVEVSHNNDGKEIGAHFVIRGRTQRLWDCSAYAVTHDSGVTFLSDIYDTEPDKHCLFSETYGEDLRISVAGFVQTTIRRGMSQGIIPPDKAQLLHGKLWDKVQLVKLNPGGSLIAYLLPGESDWAVVRGPKLVRQEESPLSSYPISNENYHD